MNVMIRILLNVNSKPFRPHCCLRFILMINFRTLIISNLFCTARFLNSTLPPHIIINRTDIFRNPVRNDRSNLLK